MPCPLWVGDISQRNQKDRPKVLTCFWWVGMACITGQEDSIGDGEIIGNALSNCLWYSQYKHKQIRIKVPTNINRPPMVSLVCIYVIWLKSPFRDLLRHDEAFLQIQGGEGEAPWVNRLDPQQSRLLFWWMDLCTDDDHPTEYIAEPYHVPVGQSDRNLYLNVLGMLHGYQGNWYLEQSQLHPSTGLFEKNEDKPMVRKGKISLTGMIACSGNVQWLADPRMSPCIHRLVYSQSYWWEKMLTISSNHIFSVDFFHFGRFSRRSTGLDVDLEGTAGRFRWYPDKMVWKDWPWLDRHLHLPRCHFRPPPHTVWKAAQHEFLWSPSRQ